MGRLRERSQSTPFALLGQERAQQLLKRALVSGRLGHAYLFRGPDGVGKQLFARALAATVNCHSVIDGEACGDCGSCKKFRSGNHPDFVVISPDKASIKIDRIRALKKELTYPPYESRRRIVLIEDIHLMRPEAANSLLKILEEPPEDNMLILTAESAREVLPTLLSRCQVVPFHSLTVEDTVMILRQQVDDISDGNAALLARLSEGSPGRAILLARTEMLALWQEVADILVLPEYSSDSGVGAVLRAAEQMAVLKENLVSFMGLMRLWLRDCLFLLAAAEDDDIMTTGIGQQVQVPQGWKSGHIATKIEMIDRAEQELARNCNRSLVCEVLLFRLQSRVE